MALSNPPSFEFLTPQQAWDSLTDYKSAYYRKYAAVYSGIMTELMVTAEPKSFWKRQNKCRVHVPIGADIASTSSDLLFSEEPNFSTADVDSVEESKRQTRLDELISLNNVHGKLNEAAESCAALGDIFLKVGWSVDLDHPILSVVQPDSAWPEYVMGLLKAIHFFTVIQRNEKGGAILRVYERYEPGVIYMALYKGDAEKLGVLINDGSLEKLGYTEKITPPVDDMLAVHIPNIKPNRLNRSSSHGRCDVDGLRDMMDALDEAYTSWMRDIRLAKARLIVPAEFLRRKPSDLFKENSYTYEFDEDVETLVALDIDPDKTGGTAITPSQFLIRAEEHQKTCIDLIRNIVSMAGYAPQSFGLNIEGVAQSGTALQIRERKSFNTKSKKQTYWKSPLQQIMTALVHLDAALYPDSGSDKTDKISLQFADSLANDITVTAGAVEMLNRAAAISTEMKVRMQHPDWSEKKITEEVERIKEEFGIGLPQPVPGLGEFEENTDKLADEEEDDQEELMSGEGEGDA